MNAPAKRVRERVLHRRRDGSHRLARLLSRARKVEQEYRVAVIARSVRS